MQQTNGKPEAARSKNSPINLEVNKDKKNDNVGVKRHTILVPVYDGRNVRVGNLRGQGPNAQNKNKEKRIVSVPKPNPVTSKRKAPSKSFVLEKKQKLGKDYSGYTTKPADLLDGLVDVDNNVILDNYDETGWLTYSKGPEGASLIVNNGVTYNVRWEPTYFKSSNNKLFPRSSERHIVDAGKDDDRIGLPFKRNYSVSSIGGVKFKNVQNVPKGCGKYVIKQMSGKDLMGINSKDIDLIDVLSNCPPGYHVWFRRSEEEFDCYTTQSNVTPDIIVNSRVLVIEYFNDNYTHVWLASKPRITWADVHIEPKSHNLVRLANSAPDGRPVVTRAVGVCKWDKVDPAGFYNFEKNSTKEILAELSKIRGKLNNNMTYLALSEDTAWLQEHCPVIWHTWALGTCPMWRKLFFHVDPFPWIPGDTVMKFIAYKNFTSQFPSPIPFSFPRSLKWDDDDNFASYKDEFSRLSTKVNFDRAFQFIKKSSDGMIYFNRDLTRLVWDDAELREYETIMDEVRFCFIAFGCTTTSKNVPYPVLNYKTPGADVALNYVEGEYLRADRGTYWAPWKRAFNDVKSEFLFCNTVNCLKIRTVLDDDGEPIIEGGKCVIEFGSVGKVIGGRAYTSPSSWKCSREQRGRIHDQLNSDWREIYNSNDSTHLSHSYYQPSFNNSNNDNLDWLGGDRESEDDDEEADDSNQTTDAPRRAVQEPPPELLRPSADQQLPLSVGILDTLVWEIRNEVAKLLPSVKQFFTDLKPKATGWLKRLVALGDKIVKWLRRVLIDERMSFTEFTTKVIGRIMKLVKTPKPAAMADVDELLKNCRNCGDAALPDSPVCRTCNDKPVENFTGNCSDCNTGAVFPEIQDVCNRCVKFQDLNKRWVEVKNLDSPYGRSARYHIVTFFINHEPSFSPDQVVNDVDSTSLDVWRTNMSSEAGAGYDVALVNAIYEDITRYRPARIIVPTQVELDPEEVPPTATASPAPEPNHALTETVVQPPIPMATLPLSSDYLEEVRAHANDDGPMEVNVRGVRQWVPVNPFQRVEPPLPLEDIAMIRDALADPGLGENNDNAANIEPEREMGGDRHDAPVDPPVPPVDPPRGPDAPVPDPPVPPVGPDGGGPVPPGPAPIAPVVPPVVPPVVAPVVAPPVAAPRYDRNSYIRPVGFTTHTIGTFPTSCLSSIHVPHFSDWIKQTHDYNSGEKPGLSLTNWFIDTVNDIVTDVDPEFYNLLPTDNSVFWAFRPIRCFNGLVGEVRPSNLRNITPNIVTPTLTEIQLLVGYGQHSSQNSRVTIRRITSHNVVICNEGIDALWNHDRLVDTDSANHISILQSLQQSTAMNKININAAVMRNTREFKFILIMQQIQGGSFRNIAKVGRVPAN